MARISDRAMNFAKHLRPQEAVDARSKDEKLAELINTASSRTRLKALKAKVDKAKGS